MEFLIEMEFDKYDSMKILDFLEKSRFVQKAYFFNQKIINSDAMKGQAPHTGPSRLEKVLNIEEVNEALAEKEHNPL